MKVLMFGWEFPPHISGGLGTACFGLTKGLAKNNVEVTFVMPRASGDEDQTMIKIISASEVEIDPRHSEFFTQNHSVAFVEIKSKLVPYIGLDDYFNVINQIESGIFEKSNSDKRKYFFSGIYGENLFQEVDEYAIVAAELAKSQDFDIIHAHDWLTYKAGIIAKKVSGKPLILHIHATEYDRSGENNLNEYVFNIEREGMMAADAVCAVSDLTRKIVIDKYGIPESKVFTLHNAIEPFNKEIKKEKFVKKKLSLFSEESPSKRGLIIL